jgi:hypothetical protein
MTRDPGCGPDPVGALPEPQDPDGERRRSHGPRAAERAPTRTLGSGLRRHLHPR